MICFSCYHFATQLGSTHENRAVRDWTTPRINPTRLPMYFSPRYGAKTRSGSRCQLLAMGWCRMHGDLRPALRRGIRSSARHGRRCGAACPVLAFLRRADPAEWPLCAAVVHPTAAGPRFGASSAACRNASIRLRSSATPLPAISKAVP